MAKAFTTDSTEHTLNLIETYKERRMLRADAQAFTSDLLEQAINDIEENPLQYREDSDALELGVRLRRWIDPTGKYICLFRYNQATDEAILDIFASTRQDWLSLLYLVQISRP
ncbi:hypothetical protein [Pantoea sp. OXWO6B1]|uniref:hypothetical protein n=1 Tax=Pantoea sp. OXWO6B1 TaxID=1835724 RepID=UPI0007C6E81E|nr:hypothetical protein [Pantoea sp. OXWO6B1]OAD98057.1 hypothetical protein A6A26_24265 [Pantoea sp. OXWO6B1]